MKKITIIFAAILTFMSWNYAQAEEVTTDWSNPSAWFSGSMTQDPKKTDVFYLVSTNVLTATDDSGKEIIRSRLKEKDMPAINKEIQRVKDSIFYDDFNYISPYYHQYTYKGLLDNPDKADSIGAEVGKECFSAFEYYMKHLNHGRPFILAGFSQGGDMAMQILRRMTKEQYSHMVAAYIIGWKVTASDTTNYYTIKPAKGETDTGVTISFNSVLNKDGIWNAVAGGTTVCINPINWKTDATPAEFTYKGRPHKVHVDTQDKVLIVDTDPAPYKEKIPKIYPSEILPSINMNSLHHWEIMLYGHQIHDNAVKRAKRKLAQF